jgi:glycosyltransferase involved in cell wall biosynthesis
MNRNFILIDHSIEDSTGHYLEYANRILRAAKSLGYRTVLGVNVRAGDVVCQGADVIDKAFSRTFWENQAISRTALITNYLRKSSKIAGNPDLAKIYAEELQSFFIRVGAKTGDIVFVPTLGGIELIAIALYSATKNAISLDWHLLFRRDLCKVEESLISKARVNHFRIVKCFSEFDARFSKGQVAFYTDTDELTERYSCAVEKVFTTLPIPIDETLGFKSISNGGPIIVSYLGDVREEKGIHLLPKLIAVTRSKGFSEADVQFRVQANLPLSVTSARVIRAKKQLINLQGKGLAILDGPFSSDAYNRLICSSDIILIPYCKKNYQARSSGIFAEALAAGVPTVYPKGTWMAKTKTLCGSVEYDDISGLHNAFLKILSNYPKHEEKSIAFSTQWRQQHSARNLLVQMLKKSKKL